MHALNNAIGEQFLEEEDMHQACNVYLQETLMEGLEEFRADHEAEDGWYSEAVMTTFLRVKRNIYTMNVNSPLQPQEKDLVQIFAEDVLGFLVNQPGVHWLAFRVIDGAIWQLDSMETPRIMSFQEVLAYVRRYPHAFLIQLLPS